jgi:hypothetical protein
MADELTPNVPAVEPAVTPAAQEPARTPVEQRAMEQGWVPEDQWQGDPEQWRPAREFLDRGELFKKIDEQGRQLREVRNANADLAKHYARVQQVAYEKAIKDLKAQRREALADGDAATALILEDKIEEVQEEAKTVSVPNVPAEQPTVAPEFVSWVQRNNWYNTDKAMKVYADAVAFAKNLPISLLIPIVRDQG